MHELVRFGSYEWLVLERYGDGSALIVTKNIIERRAYHSRRADITWKKCALRMYLNGEFYNKFSAQDKMRILESRIKNSDNPWFGTNGGEDTIDKIFLLSIEETLKYLGNSREPLSQAKRHSAQSWRVNRDSYYISNQDNSKRKAYDGSGAEYWWWLRTPGDNSKGATLISIPGAVSGGSVDGAGGVRPALCISL